MTATPQDRHEPERALTADAETRQRILSSLDESLLVEAAAGTGKTTALVGRITALLASGRTTVERIVAVTFTRRAAGELKLRLRHQLDRERQERTDPEERANLELAMARLEEARIGTIHSFCAEILRERPVEAGIDPDFEELDEEASRARHRQAFDFWIQPRLAVMSPPLRRALARLALQSWSQDLPLSRLRTAAFGLLAWRDFPAPWRREPFPRAELLDRLIEEGRSLAQRLAMGPKADRLRQSLGALEEEVAWLDRADWGGERDDDLLEARWIALIRPLKWDFRKGRGKFGPLDREEVLRRREELLALLEEFEERADADLAVGLREELTGAVERYDQVKHREGQLDFLDLLLVTRNLLRDDPSVRSHFQEHFTHLFVDEFQDTDPLQAEILLLLASDDPGERDWTRAVPTAGKLFLVGDPKQSIYRFRRADMVLYRQIKERLAAAGVATVALSRSFRAVVGIQQVINHAFSRQMTGDRDTAQPDYIPLLPHRENPEGRPSVIALPVPRPYAKYKVAGSAIDRSLPDAVAAMVDWLLAQSGWTVEDPESPGNQIPIQPRHIALLFRRYINFRSDVSRQYARAFETRQIPHVLLGARSFHQREEVETLRAALHAIEWPDDELSVYATLRGPLFGILDETLLRFRQEVGSLHPFRRRPDAEGLDDELVGVGLALEELARLHRERHRVPIVETLHRLLEGGRAHVAFALRPAGARVLSNVLHVLDLARGFEMRGGLSFRRFVELLDEQAETLQARQSPVVEEGAEGVRLMTVHVAKGLEFPVVILADPSAKLTRLHASRHIDSARGLWAEKILGCAPWELREADAVEGGLDAAEGVRVAYVAATRARDLLIVPAVGDDPWSGWVGPLNAALYPERRERSRAEEAAGCPPFGRDTVVERPGSFDMRQHDPVRPGRHRIGGDGGDDSTCEVVWWDPHALDLEVPRRYGLVAEDLLVGRGEEAKRTAGLARYRAWQQRVERAVEAGSMPSIVVTTVTECVDEPEERVEVETVSLARDAARPGGTRFGSLVHGLLERVALVGLEVEVDETAVSRLAQTLARSFDATPEEVVAAERAVVRALDHPLLRHAAGAQRSLREAPFQLPLEPALGTQSPRVLEGTLDLAYTTDGSDWVLVDFKTDRDGAEKEAYRRQLSWYATALRSLGARGSIRAVLMEV